MQIYSVKHKITLDIFSKTQFALFLCFTETNDLIETNYNNNSIYFSSKFGKFNFANTHAQRYNFI